MSCGLGMQLPGRRPADPAVVLFFLSIAAGLAFATACGFGLAWDGAYYLFKLLDRHRFVVLYHRWLHYPLQWPTLFASRLTENLTLLRALFVGTYASIPLLALLACWRVSRERAPGLFVWPALGIGLATLPGQMLVVGEGARDMQLFWVVLLWILAGAAAEHAALAVVVMTACLVDYPLAVVLFAAAAVLALGRGLVDRGGRSRLLAWGAALLVLAGLKLVFFWTTKGAYETQAISTGVLALQFHLGVHGLPLESLACTWAAGLLVVTSRFVARRSERLARWSLRLAAGAVCAAGAALFLWARDPLLWVNGNEFRTWVIFASLPLVVLAGVDGLAAPLPSVRDDLWPPRAHVIGLAGVAFLVVISTQSATWYGLSQLLRSTIAESPAPCLSSDQLHWVERTALGYWPLPAYAILLQGRTPTKLVLDHAGCHEVREGGPIRVAPWDARQVDRGWFHLQAVAAETVRARTGGCALEFASGWYPEERSRTERWSWTGGRGEVSVWLDKPTTARLRGDVASLHGPNSIALSLNGQTIATVDVARSITFTALPPIDISLDEGENTLAFVSSVPSEKQPLDGRDLAIAVGNLDVEPSGGEPCRSLLDLQ